MSKPEDRYYRDIDAVQRTGDQVEANTLMKEGWELLKIVEDVTKGSDFSNEGQLFETQRTNLIFVLGHRKEGQPIQSKSAPAKKEITGETPAGKGSECKYCPETIWWTKKDGKPTPINQDGSDHQPTCKRTKQ